MTAGRRTRRRGKRPPRLALVDLRQLADAEAAVENANQVQAGALELVKAMEDLHVKVQAELAYLQGQVHRAENLAGILVAQLEKRSEAARKANRTRREAPQPEGQVNP
jgi:hypothetical protein